jgi:hypothetical protein
MRGWIFDKQGPLSALTLFSSNNQRGTTVSGLAREDVAQAFTTFPQARLSGFVSLLPTQDIPGRLCLRGSYRYGETTINFAFEEQPVSLGIAAPGVAIKPPPSDTPDASGGIVLIVIPGWEPPQNFLQTVEKSAQDLQSRLWIFQNRPPSNDSETVSISASKLKAPANAVASLLWGRTHLLRRIIVAGPINEPFINEQILPLITASPIPHIAWLIADEPLSAVPMQIRGKRFESYELKALTCEDLIRIIAKH